MQLTRRQLIARGAGLALGAVALQIPDALLRPPWARLARAQNLPTVEANFTAAVEAITSVADVDTARWIVREFDRALPPLPDRAAVSAIVSALLDAQTLAGGFGPVFALATVEQRQQVLAGMVKNDQPDVRQIANQIIPFAAFGYWSDATLGEPAHPGGPRPERWGAVGFPGPSHGYADTYTQDGPPGFAARTDFQP
jgi:hypothetical protein